MASMIPMLAILVVVGSAALCLLSIPTIRQALMDRLSVSFGLDTDPDETTTENNDDGSGTNAVDREREAFDTTIYRE